MNAAQDGQRMFFTTLHFKTYLSQTTARVKIDRGTQTCIMPQSLFKKMFPHNINSHGTLTKNALVPAEKTWIGHNGYPQTFLEQFILDIHQTTTGISYHARFYVF